MKSCKALRIEASTEMLSRLTTGTVMSLPNLVRSPLENSDRVKEETLAVNDIYTGRAVLGLGPAHWLNRREPGLCCQDRSLGSLLGSQEPEFGCNGENLNVAPL